MYSTTIHDAHDPISCRVICLSFMVKGGGNVTGLLHHECTLAHRAFGCNIQWPPVVHHALSISSLENTTCLVVQVTVSEPPRRRVKSVSRWQRRLLAFEMVECRTATSTVQCTLGNQCRDKCLRLKHFRYTGSQIASLRGS